MKILRLLLVVFLFSAVAAYADSADVSQPDEVVKKTIDDVLSAVVADKELIHDLKKRENLVNTMILPRFDFTTMTRLTVSNSQWNLATPQEQLELVDEYRLFLTNIFSKSLAQYSDEKVTYLPMSMTSEIEAVVKCKVTYPIDAPAGVDLKLTKSANGWLVYDVEWDGVSLIRTYKSNFKSLLQQGGVANLTSVLRKKNQEIKAVNN